MIVCALAGLEELEGTGGADASSVGYVRCEVVSIAMRGCRGGLVSGTYVRTRS